MFVGFAILERPFVGMLLVKGPDEEPVNSLAPPTYRVFGPGGLMANGTGTTVPVPSELGLYRYEVLAAGSDGYELGETYRILFDFTVDSEEYVDQQTFIVT